MKSANRRKFLKNSSLATASLFTAIHHADAADSKSVEKQVTQKSSVSEANNLNSFDVTYEGEPVQPITDFSKRIHTLRIKCLKPVSIGTRFRLIMGGYRLLDPATVGLNGSPWQLKEIKTAQADALEIEQSIPLDFFSRMKTRLDSDRFREFALLVVKVKEPIPAGAVIALSIEGRANGIGVNAPLIGSMHMEVALSDAEEYQQIGKSTLLKLMPGPPEEIELRAKAMPDTHGCTELSIFMKDQLGNPSPMQSGKVFLESDGNIENLPSQLLWENYPNGLIKLQGLKIKSDDPVRIKVTDNKTGAAMVSQALVPKAINGYHHYYGEIHFHTDISADGDRPLSEAYHYARNFLQLDVLAVTEHTNGLPQFWNTLQRMFDYNLEEGKFVTLPAWEKSFRDKGHINIYGRSSDADFSWADTTKDWDNIAGFDEGQDIVVGPHVTMSPGHPPFDWKTAGKRVRFVEMLQIRGCSETNTEDKKWGINPDPNKMDGSVRTALNMGYRVGFVAGTDNHAGQPTRHHREKGYVGLTGFVAPELTREHIWDALNERHTYATSGVPIICHMEVNGALMGSEIKVSKNEKLKLKASLYGTDSIELVEIISNDKTIKSFSFNQSDVVLDENISLTDQSAYYYIRLLQKDGHRAWISPVWVDVIS